MFRKSFAVIIICIVFCFIGLLYFYQSETEVSFNFSSSPRRKVINIEIVKYDFSTDYKLPEYKHKEAVNKQDYLLEVSNSQYEIPEDHNLSRERELNSAQYHLLRYYIAQYAHKLDCLKYKGMKEYIDNILKMEYEPYSSNPAELKKQGELFIAGGLNNIIVRFGIGVALVRMKQFNKALGIFKQAARKTVRDKNCPGIVAFYFCGRLAALPFNWYLPSNDKMVNALSDRALAKAFKDGNIRPCDTQSLYRIIANSKTSMSMSRTLSILAGKTDFPEHFIDLLKGTALINKAWLARGYRLGIDYGEQRVKFLDYLKQAEVYLKKTYMARPDLPEAAGAMITVAMTRKPADEQSKIYWFNKSVRAQNDYMGAYRNMLDALYYNWTECSNQPIVDFSKALKNCRLYNTEVPLFYINALEAVAKTTSSQTWRLLFDSEQTSQNLDMIFENYFKQKLTKNDLLKFKTLDAVCMVYAGKYLKADALMKQLPEYIKKYDLNFYDALNIVQRPDIQLIQAEITLGAGKEHDNLQLINEYCAQGKFGEAEEVIKLLVKKYSTQPSIAKFLLKRLIEVSSCTQLRHQGTVRQPLFLAVRFNKKDIVKFLLDSGVDVNELDSYHRNVLGLAVSNSNSSSEIIEILLKAGADVSVLDNLSHTTPLHTALSMSKYGGIQKVKAMINHCKNFNVRGPNSLTVLDYAIHYSTPEIVGLMIEKGANPNLCDNDGWSPIYRAVLINRIDMAEALIKSGGDINIPDRKGHTPLDIAKNQKIRKLLLDYGAKSGKTL